MLWSRFAGVNISESGLNSRESSTLSQIILEPHRRISLLISVLHNDRHVDREPKLLTLALCDRARARHNDGAGRNLEGSVSRLAIKLIVHQIVHGSAAGEDCS